MARPRKFDHDKCIEMWETGEYTMAALGRHFGVAPQSVDRVLHPEKYKKRMHDAFAAICHYCGAPCTWNKYQAGQQRKGMEWHYTTVPRCRECAAIAHSQQSDHPPLDDELWCPGCKQYKPDEAFHKNSQRHARRNRRNRCKVCDTKNRREYRLKSAPACKNCGEKTKDATSIMCLSCYRLLMRRAA